MTAFAAADKKFAFLDTLDPLPRMVREALKLYGTAEQPGPGDNPVILAWVKELANPSVQKVYTHDSVAWCGLFMAIVARRAGKVPVQDPLWALNWGNFGVAAGQPMLGDVLTFIRPQGGHVALYIGESKDAYFALGGNTADKVGFAKIEKARLRAVRRPLYMNPPASAKPYLLSDDGKAFSTNEK